MAVRPSETDLFRRSQTESVSVKADVAQWGEGFRERIIVH